MLDDHKKRVASLSQQVKSFYARKEPFRVYHGSTNSTRVVTFDRNRMVDVSAFNQVLSIDARKQTALVEANVPMDQLVRATLAHGLVPPVVMEFPGITVGGGLQGGAGESSSYKWGTFNRTVNWYEMVLGDGEVVRVSPEERADLYWGAAGSYGSFGVVTAAEVQLIPAKRYVELEYIPVHSFDEARETIELLAKKAPDFIDGVMFGPGSGVIMAGNMTDVSAGRVRKFSRARDEWFYIHAQKLGNAGEVRKETVPIRDYLFRYDRGAFWTGMHAFKRLGVPFNRLTRWLLNPLMHTRKMYEALQASGVSQEFIIQDLALPAERVVEFMKFADAEYGLYPLWLCPLKADVSSPLLSNALPVKAVINVGVWGFWSREYERVEAANRRLEAKLNDLGGRKWLYAYAYYSQGEFWQLYDQGWYEALRKKYHAETLPSVYEKTCRSERREVNAKRGVLFALLGLKGIRIRK